MEKKVGELVNRAAEDKFLEMYDRGMNRWPDSCKELEIETRFGRTHIYSFGKEKGDPIIIGTTGQEANAFLKNAPKQDLDSA